MCVMVLKSGSFTHVLIVRICWFSSTSLSQFFIIVIDTVIVIITITTIIVIIIGVIIVLIIIVIKLTFEIWRIDLSRNSKGLDGQHTAIQHTVTVSVPGLAAHDVWCTGVGP